MLGHAIVKRDTLVNVLEHSTRVNMPFDNTKGIFAQAQLNLLASGTNAPQGKICP